MDHVRTYAQYIILGIVGCIVCYASFFGVRHHFSEVARLAAKPLHELPKPQPSQMTAAAPLANDPIEPTSTRTYLQITAGCGSNYEGTCVRSFREPSATATPREKLRKGVVLEVAETRTYGTTTWYRTTFTEGLRYPERVTDDWYIPEGNVRVFEVDEPASLSSSSRASSTKMILVDRSEQMLYAYEDSDLFFKERVSTGIGSTPTPRGTFTIFRKTPTRYMQGPIPGITTQYYDLPGVPWDLYFTEEGAAIHGAYWHEQFGSPWSHGCVNLPYERAEELYRWADLGTTVTVRD